MMSKKGISTVVATLLIILLTVIAVTVVWQILKPTLTSTAGKVGAGCIGMDIKVVNCTGATGVRSITVTTNAGSPDKLKVILYNKASGVTLNNTLDTSPPKQFETKIYGLTGDGSGDTANIVGVITTSGQDQYCDLGLSNVDCA